MKTIKIIDLLNKIANGEEVPKKIIWNKLVYNYKDGLYYDYCGETLIGSLNFDGTNLHDEIEIIEEEKKIPEKLEPLQKDYMTLDDIKFTFSNSEMIIVDKINSIIDYLESKEEGE